LFSILKKRLSRFKGKKEKGGPGEKVCERPSSGKDRTIHDKKARTLGVFYPEGEKADSLGNE